MPVLTDSKDFPKRLKQFIHRRRFNCVLSIWCAIHYFTFRTKNRKEVATDLKMIYQAPALEEADYQLGKFADKWNEAYPMVVKSWQQNWVRMIPMFSSAPESRKAIYTTYTIESLNMTLRKIIKNRAMFPSDEAVFRILYLALKNISKKWTMPIANWSEAMNQFAIFFENRLLNGSFNHSSFTQII